MSLCRGSFVDPSTGTGWVADDPGTRQQKRLQGRRQHGASKVDAGRLIPIPDIAVNQDRTGPEVLRGFMQLIDHVAQVKVAVRRDTIRMGADFPFKDINFTAGHVFTNVVIGPTVAEPQFQDNTGRLPDICYGIIQQAALRIHAPNKTFQT